MTSAPDPAVTLYALASMLRHAPAAERARRLGPDLFPDNPSRAVAALILTGSTARLETLSTAERRAANALGREVVACGVPGPDAGWAVYLVGLLARERSLPLLASTLRWAADRIDERVPLAHVRRCLADAFRVAESGNDTVSADRESLPSEGLGVAA